MIRNWFSWFGPSFSPQLTLVGPHWTQFLVPAGPSFISLVRLASLGSAAGESPLQEFKVNRETERPMLISTVGGNRYHLMGCNDKIDISPHKGCNRDEGILLVLLLQCLLG